MDTSGSMQTTTKEGDKMDYCLLWRMEQEAHQETMKEVTRLIREKKEIQDLLATANDTIVALMKKEEPNMEKDYKLVKVEYYA